MPRPARKNTGVSGRRLPSCSTSRSWSGSSSTTSRRPRRLPGGTQHGDPSSARDRAETRATARRPRGGRAPPRRCRPSSRHSAQGAEDVIAEKARIAQAAAVERQRLLDHTTRDRPAAAHRAPRARRPCGRPDRCVRTHACHPIDHAGRSDPARRSLHRPARSGGPRRARTARTARATRRPSTSRGAATLRAGAVRHRAR